MCFFFSIRYFLHHQEHRCKQHLMGNTVKNVNLLDCSCRLSYVSNAAQNYRSLRIPQHQPAINTYTSWFQQAWWGCHLHSPCKSCRKDLMPPDWISDPVGSDPELRARCEHIQTGAQKLCPVLPEAEAAPVHEAGKGHGWWGGSVLWQKTRDDNFWHSRYAKEMRTKDGPWSSVGKMTRPIKCKPNSPISAISITLTM